MNSFESWPVGFGFRPREEELVNDYLKKKILGLDDEVKAIPVVDVYKWEPWELPSLSVIKSKDQEWFFFCHNDFKYSRGNRCNRATRTGFWRITGRERLIRGEDNFNAAKKTLVFYSGRVPGNVKTNWVMHEYSPKINFKPREAFVLCRLKKNKDKVNRAATSGDVAPSGSRGLDLESLSAELLDSEVDEESLFHSEPYLSDYMSMLQSCQEEESSVFSFASTDFSDVWTDNVQIQLEASQEETDLDDFVNSLIVDGDHSIHQGGTNSCLNDFNQIESFRMVGQHVFSSDTDVESTMQNQFLGHSSLSDVHTSSNVHRLVRTTELPRRGPASPTKFQYSKKENVFTLMCVTAVESSEDTSPCITPPSKSKDLIVPHSSARRIRLQKRSQFKSEKPKEPEVCNSTTKASVSASGVSSGSDGNRSPVILQSCRICVKPSPPYENLVNVIAGIFLFVVFLRVMLLFGDW